MALGMIATIGGIALAAASRANVSWGFSPALRAGIIAWGWCWKWVAQGSFWSWASG